MQKTIHSPNALLTGASLLLAAILLAGCAAARLQAPPADAGGPERLLSDAVLLQDGYRLPLRSWLPAGKPRAMVLALHGFNDYSNAFADMARYLTDRSIATYAVDQRGFGAAAQAGIWAGSTRMQSDLVTVAALLCREYPGIPLYLFGESMGGAVILGASPQLDDSCASAVILSAPAVWGWSTMPWWQRTALHVMARLAPAMTVTGEGLDIRPSDNIEMLRALGRDPLVIKETRIDAVFGLTNLMQAAYDQSTELSLPVLLLYGEQDEIITPRPLCSMLSRVQAAANGDWQMQLYPDGFHMLTRDLQARVVLADIAAWIGDPTGALPSGHDVRPDTERLRLLCGWHTATGG